MKFTGIRHTPAKLGLTSTLVLLLIVGCSENGENPTETNDPKVAKIGLGSEPSWSPDGKFLAMQRDGYLFVLSVETGSERVLTVIPSDRPPDGDWNDSEPDWSPDGNWILFNGKGRNYSELSDSRDIWKYPAEGGTPIQITALDDRDTYHPAYSPDGDYIAYLLTHHDLHVISAEGGDSRLLAEDALDCQIAWSPDGTEIAYISDEGLSIVNVATEENQLLTPHPYHQVPNTLFYSCAWSPDGNTIAVSRHGLQDGEEDGIWLLSADDGTGSPLHIGDYDAPDWSPDGKHLAVKKRISSSVQELWLLEVK